MRIDEIRIRNFRAFEDLRLRLEPDVTLLVGRNAAGKSTILDALAIALRSWAAPALPKTSESVLDGKDARLVLEEHEGRPAAARIFPVSIALDGEFFDERVSWRVQRDREADGEYVDSSDPMHDWNHRLRWSNAEQSASSLPLLAYYGSGRLWGSWRREPGRPLGHSNRRRGYEFALDANSDHEGFEEFMAWRTQDRIQRLATAFEEGRTVDSVQSPDLDAVSAAACGCLEGARKLHYSVNHQELRVDFAEGTPSIPFGALSDGQRNLIAMAADIAWRAVQLNPHLGAAAPKETPGVVLIDEIDLHLHPAWQREVLANLTKTFPQLQFVTTTHSPQVISAAESRWIRLIDPDHTVHSVDRAQGKDTNAILEDIMGVPSRPPDFKGRLEKLARLIEDEKTEEAEKLLNDLASELGEDDAAIVAARWELSFAGDGHAAH